MDDSNAVSSPTSPAPPSTPQAAPKRRRRGLRILAALFLLILVLIGALLGTAWWAARSESGTAWLLSVLPGVQVEAPKGSLLADFEARKLVVQPPGGKDRITLTDVGWRGLDLQRGTDPLWARIVIESLYARRVDAELAPAPTTDQAPLQAPTSLKLPIELELRALKIGEAHATPLGDKPLRDVDAALHLGANAGAEHRIERLALRWDRLTLDASARIAGAAPMALDAKVALAQDAAENLPAWNANATLTGPLAEPVLEATLRASPAPTQPAQSLDVRATLRPFAPWPLGDLTASAEALDLSAFSSAAPVTALSLKANATSSGLDQPASVVLALKNAKAGRWDEARLPLHDLTLEVAARPDQPSDLELRALTAEFGTPKDAAGKITAKGRWSPERWNIDATVATLRPSRLDGRAPVMDLSGPISAKGGAPGSDTDVKSTLEGRLVEGRTSHPVKVDFDASVGAQRIEVRSLQAAAGAARATASGLASRAAADGPWAVKAKVALAEFDPGVWLPGADSSPWRRAKNRLNAKVDIDTIVTPPTAGQPALEALAALRGTLALSLDQSLLAGVPLSGEATLRSDAGAAARARVSLDAGGNRVRIDGSLATSGPGAGDAWDVAIDAGSLERLAPVFKLFQPTGADTTLSGAVNANARITGRWPAVQSRGDLEATRLRVGTIGVQKAQARWSAGSSATDAVDVQATVTQATMAQKGAPGPTIEDAELQLKGTARAHTLSLLATSNLRPPEWAEAAAAGAAPAPAGAAATPAASAPRGATTPQRTVVDLRARGGLVDQPGADLSGWRGTLDRLEVRASDTPSTPLVRTRDVALEAFWAGGPARATVQPGRVELLGGALQWSRLVWQDAGSGGGLARIEVDAQLEPLRIAPLLARAQPDFGWGGDLTIAGRVKVRSAPGFKADIVIERGTGDLSVTDELGSRALGLTDLRLGLDADNGVWNFTAGVVGKALGVTSGAVVVRASPQDLWPKADAPLQGVVELTLADLGALGTWVPPGWRVGGGVHASASFAGRFGAPEYVGAIEGTKLSVRNFLEGVNVSDGDIAIRLKGTSATIERFTAKAGNGSLRIDGSASFGETPEAQLDITASRFQLLGRVDRRIVASGAGRLRLDKKSLTFTGKFGVDEGLVDFTRSDAPALSDDVHVTRAAGAASPAAAASAAASPRKTAAAPLTATPAPTRDVVLDLRVDLGDKLALRGRGLDARLGGELHITSPGGKMAFNGSIRVVDGSYQAYGQPLKIDRGVITFSGPIDRPRLDIEATRPKLENIRVGVKITGSAATPRVRLFSEPELSEVDKLSWLVMGHASDKAGRTESALLQRAALALVSGEGPGVTDKVTAALGLDELSLGQTTDGEVKQTVLTVGKQLSDRVSIGYEQGLNATVGSFQLIYRIASRFTLRAQTGEDNALDLIWTWRWQ